METLVPLEEWVIAVIFGRYYGKSLDDSRGHILRPCRHGISRKARDLNLRLGV